MIAIMVAMIGTDKRILTRKIRITRYAFVAPPRCTVTTAAITTTTATVATVVSATTATAATVSGTVATTIAAATVITAAE